LSPNKETGLRSRVAGDGLDTGRHAFNAIAGFQCKSVICQHRIRPAPTPVAAAARRNQRLPGITYAQFTRE